MKKTFHLAAVLLPLTVTDAAAQSPTTDGPEIHGTVRAKYEYQPGMNKGRFEVRNARLGIEDRIVPAVGYKAEIDLSDEGNIRMLDAYVLVRPQKALKLTLGQMRVPFTIDAHRSPHLQYFANRSFIAKQTGDVRDAGAAASWTLDGPVPVTLEGGVFNGSGLTNQKNFWTGNYNFSFKAQTLIARRWGLALSCQKATAGETDVMMYDAGAYWHNSRWHIEGEYLRKHYNPRRLRSGQRSQCLRRLSHPPAERPDRPLAAGTVRLHVRPLQGDKGRRGPADGR